jgi:hypothetical protein
MCPHFKQNIKLCDSGAQPVFDHETLDEYLKVFDGQPIFHQRFPEQIRRGASVRSVGVWYRLCGHPPIFKDFFEKRTFLPGDHFFRSKTVCLNWLHDTDSRHSQQFKPFSDIFPLKIRRDD